MNISLPPLDRRGGTPMRAQIANHLGRAIRGGQLRAGDRLPPIRDLAEQCGVTRSTVQGAYHRLADAGLVAGTVGRGTVVLEGFGGGGSGVGEAPSQRVVGGGGDQPLGPAVAAVLEHSRGLPRTPGVPAGTACIADFANLTPDRSSFPVDALRTALDEVLRQRGDEVLDYDRGDALTPADVAPLTGDDEPATIADPGERVVITSGAQQAIDLVVRACTSPGDVVAVPVPTYPQLTGVLRAAGVDIAPVAWGSATDADGLPDLGPLADVLRRRAPRLLCLMPTFHNPTGRTLGEAARQRLMALLAEHQTVVLEDEYQRPLRFRGAAPRPLRQLDPRGRTVTVHSLSKHLFPGMRVGWIQGPEALLGPIAALKRAVDLGTSPLLQAAMIQFARAGHLQRHLAALRSTLEERHRVAQDALRGALPEGSRVSDPDGGLALWLELPGAGLGDQLAERAAAHGVRVTPGRAFDPWSRPSNGCRIAVARTTPEQIQSGLAVLARCAHELVGSGTPASLVL